MSKRESNAPGWISAPQSHMATDPSVGRFSNDQTVSLLAKDPSVKFSDNDRTKSLAPFSNHGQHSQQPSQQPAGTDIVDLRTAQESEWKRYGFVNYVKGALRRCLLAMAGKQQNVSITAFTMLLYLGLFRQQSRDFQLKGIVLGTVLLSNLTTFMWR